MNGDLAQALMTMGFGLLGAPKGRELERFGKAGLLSLADYNERLREKRRNEIADVAMRRENLQMEQIQAQMAAQQAAAAEQATMRGAAMQSFRPPQAGSPETGPPTSTGAMQPAVAAQPGGFDAEAYAQRLYGMGRVQDAMAVEKLMQKKTPFAEFKPENYTVSSVAEAMRTGDMGKLVPVTAEPVLPVGKANPSDFTPDSVAAFVASGGKDYSLLRPIDKTPRTTVSVDARGRGKAPEGFQWAPDGESLMPIPGGPKDTSVKDTARATGAVNRADIVIAKIDKALGQVGLKSAGLGGSIMANVPGTTAVDLKKNVDTVKANIGFQELQAMREASPTGGALGQVAVQELQMLQAVVSSLDTEQSPAQLRENLAQARKHFTNWKSIVKKAAETGAGRSASGVIKFSDLPE